MRVFVGRDDDGGEWRVRRGTVLASGTEQASSNRTFTFPLPAPIAPSFFLDAVGAGVGESAARSRAVHCGTLEECVRSEIRIARVNTVRALRATGAPLVTCVRRRERTCSLISTLCRMGAVAETI